MKSILVAIFLLVTFPVLCQSPLQSISGKVLDADTRIPIIGANIVLVNSKPLLGAVSDNNGEFAINFIPIGRYTVQSSFIGYNSSTIPEILIVSGKELALSILLKESAVISSEVVISANHDKGKASNDMAIISARSFTVEESRRYAGAMDDPMRAVSGFAGVSGSADVNSNGIVVRGNSPKGILWKLEEVDIPNPNHFSYVGQSAGGVTVFSSHVLANSDFYTGAFPGEYGNALSGVFDIKFRNGNNRKHEYSTQLGISGVDIAAEGPFLSENRASYLFNYRYSMLGFIQAIDPSMKNKIPSYQDLSFKINIPTENAGVFSLFGIGGLARSKYSPDYEPTQVSNEERQRSELNNDMGAMGLSHSLILGRSTLIKTTLGATYNMIYYKNGFINPDLAIVNTDETEYKNSKLSMGSWISNKISSNHTNKTGFTFCRLGYNIDIKAKDILTGQFGPFVNEQGTSGLIQAFTESRIDLSENLSLNLGIHWQKLLLNDNSSIEPRVAIAYKFLPAQTLSFGFGNHSQLEDLGIYLAKDANGIQQNKTLGFSKANHFVLGYTFNFTSDKQIKIEVYQQELYNVPVIPFSSYSMINNPGGYMNDLMINSGTGKNRGIDITFEKYLSDDYYYLVTASFYESKYTGGDGIERNSRYNGKYACNLLFGKEFIFENGNILGLNLRTSFTGGEYYEPVDLISSIQQNREVVNRADAFNQSLKDFYYIDLSLLYRINYNSFAIVFAVQVKNLLNEKPVTGYSFNTLSKELEEKRPMGIIPMINCKVEF